MDKKEVNSNFLKNPIGVIGFFLVLVEAIASLVVAYSNLCEYQNTILVLFIVFFPCIVLAVFHNLVTKHHKKLYSPSDYRDEKNFVGTYDSLTQKDVVVPLENNVMIPNSTNDITIIKNAVADILELQKRMIPKIEESSMPEHEKEQMVSSLNDYINYFDLISTECSDVENENDHSVNYRVKVSPLFKSTKFVKDLINKGYEAEIYRFDPSDTRLVTNVEHQAIWIGLGVPFEMVIDVIRTAKKFYPHLKYVKLSNCSVGVPKYVRYQIYIGGATSTAIENGLKPLTEENFEELYKIKSTAELHAYVSSFM